MTTQACLPSQQDFVFLSFDGPGRQLDRGLKRLANRHVMNDYLKKQKPSASQKPTKVIGKKHHTIRRSPSTKSVSPKQTPSTTTDSPDSFALVHYSNQLSLDEIDIFLGPQYSPGSHMTDPFNCLPCDTKHIDIPRWFFLNPQNPSSPRRTIDDTRGVWRRQLWEATNDSRLLFNFVACASIQKQAHFTGTEQNHQYFEHKDELLAGAKHCVGQKIDSTTVTAMAGMAFLNCNEGNFDEARLHLNSVKKVINEVTLNEYQWLCVTWPDFRLAFLTGSKPILDYHVPDPFQTTLTLNEAQSRVALYEAERSVIPLPVMPEVEPLEAVKVFKGLHMTAMIKKDFCATNKLVKFGCVYDASYNLCRMVGALANQPITDTSSIAYVLLLTAQLTFFELSCYWLPVDPILQTNIFQTLTYHLGCIANLEGAWEIHNGHLQSLLWVLFMATSKALEQEPSRPLPYQDVLVRTIDRLRIYSEADLLQVLKTFPFIHDWTDTQSAILWKRLYR